MCSYNRVNNSYGCQNSKTLNGLLKTELGFQVIIFLPSNNEETSLKPGSQGFVMSDWGAIHGGVAAAEAGLDIAFPDDSGYWGKYLVEAVKNGTMPEARVDDMITRQAISGHNYLQQLT